MFPPEKMKKIQIVHRYSITGLEQGTAVKILKFHKSQLQIKRPVFQKQLVSLSGKL